MTEGRRRLLAALETTTRTAIANAVGVSVMAVSRWASRDDEPPSRYRHRVALRDVVGVDLDAWERPAHSEPAHNSPTR